MHEPKAVAASEAARLLGLTPAGLKGLRMEGRGPRPIKLGDSRQARVLYALDAIDSWLADPAGYERRTKRRAHRGRTAK